MSSVDERAALVGDQLIADRANKVITLTSRVRSFPCVQCLLRNFRDRTTSVGTTPPHPAFYFHGIESPKMSGTSAGL